MTIADAQRDIRRAYVGGAPGVLVSALVWLVAAVVQQRTDTATAFTALFIGGFFIFPLSKLICMFGFRRSGEARDNGLAGVAFESTIAMAGGLLAAWLFLRVGAPELVMPIAAIAVGTHYFPFKTLYGDRTYWLLAAGLTLAGVAGIFAANVLPAGTTFIVAAVEAVVGILLLVRAKPEG